MLKAGAFMTGRRCSEALQVLEVRQREYFDQTCCVALIPSNMIHS